MKMIMLYGAFLFATSLLGQTFGEVSGTPFEGVLDGAVAFADVDGDNDQDVLITGINRSTAPTAVLYRNVGNGQFEAWPNSPFDGVQNSAVAFADVDGDNDADVLITGTNNSFSRTSKLYVNDGDGNFTFVAATPFIGVQDGAIAFADVDGDGDQDVLITGRNSPAIPSMPVSNLYVNDGEGNFTEVMNTGFEGVFRGSVAFADVDDDNDLDVLITGENDSDSSVSELYINDSAGNFTPKANNPFEEVRNSSIAFADVDGDNDEDVLITGWRNAGRIAKLYINDGFGEYTERAGTPFEGVAESSIAFADVNDDSHVDVLITGAPQSGRISKLYVNDGDGHFSEVAENTFDDVRTGSVAMADVDGDNDIDILITGENDSNELIAKLYRNDVISSIEDLVASRPFHFELYPNPTTTGKVNMRFSNEMNAPVEIRIFDLMGTLVEHHVEATLTGAGSISLPVLSLASGCYIVQLDDGSRTASRPLFIETN